MHRTTYCVHWITNCVIGSIKSWFEIESRSNDKANSVACCSCSNSLSDCARVTKSIIARPKIGLFHELWLVFNVRSVISSSSSPVKISDRHWRITKKSAVRAVIRFRQMDTSFQTCRRPSTSSDCNDAPKFAINLSFSVVSNLIISSTTISHGCKISPDLNECRWRS